MRKQLFTSALGEPDHQSVDVPGPSLFALDGDRHRLPEDALELDGVGRLRERVDLKAEQFGDGLPPP